MSETYKIDGRNVDHSVFKCGLVVYNPLTLESESDLDYSITVLRVFTILMRTRIRMVTFAPLAGERHSQISYKAAVRSE